MINQKNFFRAICSALIFSACSVVAQVDTSTEAEKRYLIKLAQELKALDELSGKAAANADPDARVVFDYVSLQNDVREMRRAIEQHVNAPSRSPRKIKSLELKQQ